MKIGLGIWVISRHRLRLCRPSNPALVSMNTPEILPRPRPSHFRSRNGGVEPCFVIPMALGAGPGWGGDGAGWERGGCRAPGRCSRQLLRSGAPKTEGITDRDDKDSRLFGMAFLAICLTGPSSWSAAGNGVFVSRTSRRQDVRPMVPFDFRLVLYDADVGGFWSVQS